MTTRAKKQPPLKKRHTKPCKFFQFGRCPHTADVCNFAHVSVIPCLSQPPRAPAGMVPPCKPYQAGQYVGEGVCVYGHPPDVSALNIQMNNMQLSPTSPISPGTPFSGDYHYPSPYTGSYPPYYQTWPPSPYHEHSGPITGNGNQNTCSDSPSISASASTSTDGISQLSTPGGMGMGVSHKCDHDDVAVVTEDPQFAEHAHTHQSRIHVLDMDALSSGSHGIGISPTSVYPLTPPPPWDAPCVHYCSHASATPVFGGDVGGDCKGSRTNPPTRSSSRASSRSKLTKYKTKPCKFFNTENGCPSGDSCTFIHDASIPPVPPVIRSHSKSPDAPGNGGDNDKANMEYDKDKEKDKDKSQAEERDNKNPKRNFFPITWRVIGGGVLIGGRRMSNAGEIQHYYQDAEGLATVTAESLVRVDDDGLVKGQKKGLRSSIFSRPRSRSISSPSTGPVDGIGKNNDNLFAAESP